MLNSLTLRLNNLNDIDEHGNTILHNALNKKDVKLISEVLARVVSTGDNRILNVQNKQGDTPLHIAVRKYPLDKVSNLMISLGASPHIVNKKHERVFIAPTIAEYLKKTNYAIDLAPDDDVIVMSAISVVGRDETETSPLKTYSQLFPDSITVEDKATMSERLLSASFPSDLTVIDRDEMIIPPRLVGNCTNQKV